MNDRTLEGKTAFVSGSGRNIGRAIALDLARLGANVVINGRNDRDACDDTLKAVIAHDVKAAVEMGDMGNADDVARVTDAALGRFGTLDIVVNNAAVRPHKPFLETTEDDWSSVIDVALYGALRTSRAFLPGMVDRQWGRIINFTGMKAIRGYFEGAPISAAKHGVVGMTRALSTEFAMHGITVNAVSPGVIRTGNRDGSDPKVLKGIPAGRMGEADEIAATVAFLASPGGAYISGQMIAVNGGAET